MSYADAQRLGIGHLHPAATGETETEVLRRLGVADIVPPKTKNPVDGMNKTERAFYQEVKASPHVVKILREPFKLRLAGRTWYTPDFLVYPLDEPPTFVEIKGYMRDDAAVKLKVAAEMYAAEWRWLLVRRAGQNGWEVREVTRTGIGTHPIVVPWIGGG